MAKILTCDRCGATSDKWGTSDCPTCRDGAISTEFVSTPTPKPLPRANKPTIRIVMRTLYRRKRESGKKVPNIIDTKDEVLADLKLQGLTTEKSIIQEIAKEFEFKNLREPPGVRHNNKGIARRRRNNN